MHVYMPLVPHQESEYGSLQGRILGDPGVTANLYCNVVNLYWEGCVICSIYLL